MEKKEIEKAVEKGESAWVVFNQYSHENNSVKEIDFTKVEGVELHNDYFQYFYGKNLCGHRYELIFKTKAEAEHYLHHANVERVEKLPFLTWEEFKVGKELFFTNKSGYPMCLCVVDTRLSKKIGLGGANGYFDLQQIWDLTEVNFYKAYDECVRLFKGE